jgi:hypothetical protein
MCVRAEKETDTEDWGSCMAVKLPIYLAK